MAERRMFAKTIIDSDAFLDMPLSAQALYFHLSMRADDDGFVNNPKKLQRMVGAGDDDFKLLIVKRFILAFDSGVIVIKHWKMHNYIQKDRYKPTVYQEEKSQIAMKENGVYTDCIQNGYKMDTQDRKEIEEGQDNSFILSAETNDENMMCLEDKEGAKREFMAGSLSEGLVFMSDEQFEDLCEKLSYDEINHYFEIIKNCERTGKKFTKKTHYQAILDMVAKDRKVK